LLRCKICLRTKHVKPINVLTTLKKKPPIVSINMVALVTKSQKNEEQVFKKREPLKTKRLLHIGKNKKR
jgi:hypothetical protein